jgi:hypothetical protein
VARLGIATEFRRNPSVGSRSWLVTKSEPFLLFRVSRGRTPEKGGNMDAPTSVLAIALLVAVLVIDRLTR